MEINWVAVLVATVAQFIIGAVWYSVFFGKLWGRIHGFDKLSQEVQKKMMKSMGPMYGVQFLITLITSTILAIFINYQPTWNPYAMAGFFWLGFVVPTQVASVIWGGTESKWIVKKIAVQAGSALLCLEVAAAIIYVIM